MSRPRAKAKPVKKRRRRSRRHLATGPGQLIIQGGACYWLLPRRIRSLNNIRTGIARHHDTLAWEKLFVAAQLVSDDQSFPTEHPVLLRMRLDIQRLAPQKRWRLDRANFAGGCKGLEDALKRLGYLVDDNDQWLENGTYSQDVSADRCYWAVIKLSPSTGIIQKVVPLWPAFHTEAT